MSEDSPIGGHQSPITGSSVADQSPAINHHPPSPSPDDEEISLLDLAIVLAKHKWLVIGLPFISAVIAAGMSLLLPNIYTGVVKILPPQQTQSNAVAILGQLGASGGASASALGVRNLNDVFIAMLKSRAIADELIGRFELRRHYGDLLLTDVRGKLAANTNIVASRDGLVTIEFEDPDPRMAAQIANGYVEALEKLTLNFAVTEASQRRLFFEKQLKLANAALADAQAELKKFQEGTGLVSESLLNLSATTSATLRAQITAKQIQLTGMRSFATGQNPDVIRIEQELTALRSQLARIENDVGSKEGSVVVGIEKVPEAGLEFLKRVREVKYYETLFDMLARQFEAAKMDEAKNVTLIQVMDPAIEPEKKSKPKRKRMVMFVALVAGFIAVLLAFAWEALKKASTKQENVEKFRAFRRYLSWGGRAH